jgi:alkylation response protein AidB-like acyl-CoA dehydrogenase
MDFALSEDQKLFASTVKNLLTEQASPARIRQAWSNELEHPNSVWTNLAEMGVLGMTCPESHDGLGMSPMDWVVVLEECGRVALPDPVLESMVVGTELLNQCGSASLKDQWLPKLATGEVTLSVALSSEAFVVAADQVDLILAQKEDKIYALKPKQFECTRQDSVDGARRIFTLDWDATKHEAIAQGPDALDAIRDAQLRGTLAAAAQLLGLSHQMLDMSIEYAKTRTQFGKAIGSFQAIKHKLADAWLKLEFARPVVYRAAHSLTHDRTGRDVHVAMAKAYASDLGMHASKTALQCHGAIGYSFEYDLHLWMKRAWSLASTWGDAAHHRSIIAAEILDKDDQEDMEL